MIFGSMRTSIHVCSSVCAKMLKLLKSTFQSVVMAGTQTGLVLKGICGCFLCFLFLSSKVATFKRVYDAQSYMKQILSH